ncbi:MAG: metal-sulfur cluster assembly factor [Ignavibacteriales bacterium]|nr:metal-sulfur cluster assembly factor [Ignavibacteriales bacterium]
MATRESIREALKMVIDPELGLNLVDLGLIYDIDLDEDSIHIAMTLTTAGCPLHESMIEAVRHVAQSSDLTKMVYVDLVWEPPWTPELMSEDAKKTLGWSTVAAR